jgi:hypothetical protein
MGKKRINERKYKLGHDEFIDETFGMPSLGSAFLKEVLPKKLQKRLDLDRLVVERVKFRDELFRETRPDIVYKVPFRRTDEYIRFYTIIEHKSFDDHSAIFQTWGYVRQLSVLDVNERLTDPKTKKKCKTWPKGFLLSPIIPIILHHGKKPFSGETQLVNLFYPLPGAKEYLPHMQAILFDLSTIEKEMLPRDPNAPELYVVLLMMKVIFSKSRSELKATFKLILKELEPYSKIPKYRELIRKCWYYFLYNAEKLIEADYFEAESDVREAIGEDKLPTLVQLWEQRGRVQGKVEGKAELIIAMLEDRFGEVPQATQEAIAKITDRTVIRQLALLAGNCKSLAEFAKALK